MAEFAPALGVDDLEVGGGEGGEPGGRFEEAVFGAELEDAEGAEVGGEFGEGEGVLAARGEEAVGEEEAVAATLGDGDQD